MGTMPDGTSKNLLVDDGITPDPALPPTSVDASAREAEERKWTPTKIAIWAAISDNGLARITTRIITNFTRENNGLSSNNIYPLYEDAEGIMWSGAWRSGK